MPRTPMPLPEEDYTAVNISSYNEFFEITQHLPQPIRHYIVNATHRLAEVDWITRRLEKEIRTTMAPPIVQEGLLSLQLYLLLTCADTLGHVYGSAGGVGKRFRAFFEELPQDAKRNLIDSLIAWKTSRAELPRLGLWDATTNRVRCPSRQQVLRAVQPLVPEKRLEAVVDFLYYRRNYYTHESEYPMLGHHPNLSVIQNQRLKVPSTAALGELDRLQVVVKDDSVIFVYFETDDVIAAVRWSIVRGLGKIIGRV